MVNKRGWRESLKSCLVWLEVGTEGAILKWETTVGTRSGSGKRKYEMEVENRSWKWK
jgi:hypothetical protein